MASIPSRFMSESPFALYGDTRRGVTTDFFFDGRNIRALAVDLEKAAAALGREAAPLLAEIGADVESKAKNIAAGNGSQSIPETIHGGLRGPFEYRIQAGGEDNEIAGLWELGNRARSRSSPTFWHPVWGTSAIVEQPRYPFLRPALDADRAKITARMELMWDKALGPYRLGPSAFGMPTIPEAGAVAGGTGYASATPSGTGYAGLGGGTSM